MSNIASITSEAKNRYYWVMILVVALSIFATFFSSNGTGIYKYIYFLPAVYALLNVVFFRVYKNITIPTAIVLVFMFLRYCVTPMVLALESFPVDAYYIEYYSNNIFYAMFIMLYEMLIFYIGLSSHKYGNRQIISDSEYIKRLQSDENFMHISPITGFLLLFTVTIYLVYPSLLSNYSFIISYDLDSIVSTGALSTSSLPSGMRFIGFTCGEIFRYIFVGKIILACFEKYKKRGKGIFWWISLLAICVNAVIANSRIMMGLLMAVVFLYQIYKLYPKYRRRLYVLAIVAGYLFLIAVTIHYWGNALGWHSMSIMLQNYTNGFYDVYQAWTAYQKADLSLSEKLQMFLWGDGAAKIVAISSYVKPILNTSDIYNFYLYGSDFNGGVVVPLVSQMSYYLTPVLGPWVIYFYLRMMKKFEYKARIAKGNISLNLYMSVVFAVAPFMFNNSIMIHAVTTTILPLWAVSALNGKLKIRKRCKSKLFKRVVM